VSTLNHRVIESRLTAERLRSYRIASGDDLSAAIRLYDWNIEMSGALHEDLGRVEVLFRNAMDASLRRYGAKHHWPTVWYRRRQLFPGKLARRALADIAAARFRATLGGIPERHGKVIAELNFGFWRFLCAGAYHTSLWVPALAEAFPHDPSSGNAREVRQDVDDRMQRLHFLRNRIAHHEPIHQRNLQRDHAQLQELAGWMCPESRSWIVEMTRTPDVLGQRPMTTG
jgi:hypothetical protein